MQLKSHDKILKTIYGHKIFYDYIILEDYKFIIILHTC
jgi:hypothetical protein